MMGLTDMYYEDDEDAESGAEAILDAAAVATMEAEKGGETDGDES